MAQPSGQLALASEHSSEYFWYAQGTGIWDAKNSAMLTKTGSAGMSIEGGANVALGNSATTYALASLVNIASPWTLIIRVRASTGGSGYDGVACGEAAGTSNFLWFRPDYNTYNFRVNGDTPSGSSTVTALATWAFTFSGTTLTAYKDGASVGTHSIASGSTLRLDTLLGGLSDGSLKLNGSFEFANVIPSALTAGEVASRTSDPYAVLAASGSSISCTQGSATASGFAASIAVATVIACSLGAASGTGYQANVAVSSATTINCALGSATASGYAASVSVSGTGTLVTEAFKNNTGTLLTSLTVDKVWLIDFANAADFTSAVTNGTTGELTVSGSGIVPGHSYLVVSANSAGTAVGVQKVTATG